MKPRIFAPRPLASALFGVALLLAGTLALHGVARADIDVRLDLGNAPTLSGFYFNAPPHRVYDSTSGVYVIDDPDVGDMDAFQYGGYYWVFRDGFWYRSSDWRNGFETVSPQYVPTQLYSVPAYHWKHHPSYDSWHYRGWHTRDWQDRTSVGQTRDRDWNDNGQVYRTPTTTYRDQNGSYRSQNGYYDSNGNWHVRYYSTPRTYRTRDVQFRATVRTRHHHHHHYDRDRDYDDRDRNSY